MPQSTIGLGGIELLPANFGVWSGPGYSGGRIFGKSDDIDGAVFRRIYGSVLPVAFLDAGPRKHDLAYEYAMRMYGEGSPRASVAAQNLTQFVADMDLLKSIFRYQSASYDFISPGDVDFIGAYYQRMQTFAFYLQAVNTYGLGPHLHQFWQENFAGVPEPTITDLRTLLANGLPEISFAEKWGDSALWNGYGLENLATSDFLSDTDRQKNLGLTQQEMMLFNQHLAMTVGQPHSQSLSTVYRDKPLNPAKLY